MLLSLSRRPIFIRSHSSLRNVELDLVTACQNCLVNVYLYGTSHHEWSQRTRASKSHRLYEQIKYWIPKCDRLSAALISNCVFHGRICLNIFSFPTAGLSRWAIQRKWHILSERKRWNTHHSTSRHQLWTMRNEKQMQTFTCQTFLRKAHINPLMQLLYQIKSQRFQY